MLNIMELTIWINQQIIDCKRAKHYRTDQLILNGQIEAYEMILNYIDNQTKTDDLSIVNRSMDRHLPGGEN